MCSGPDLDPCEVWKLTEIKKSRKAHRCNCCGTTIPKGSSYFRLFTVHEGEASSEKSCQACHVEAQEFAADHGTRGTPSYMVELYQECVLGAEDEDDAESWAKWSQVLEDITTRGETAKCGS